MEEIISWIKKGRVWHLIVHYYYYYYTVAAFDQKSEGNNIRSFTPTYHVQDNDIRWTVYVLDRQGNTNI